MTIRKVVLTALAVGIVVSLAVDLRNFGHPAAAASIVPSRPLVLTAVPSIGVVYWRYNCAAHGPIRWSFGIHIWNNAATTGVRFKAGRVVRVRQLQPGFPTYWLPYSGKRVQYLAVTSGGEEGTVVGVVRADYGSPSREPHCFPYAPPRVTVQIYPRRYYNSHDVLRRFIG